MAELGIASCSYDSSCSLASELLKFYLGVKPSRASKTIHPCLDPRDRVGGAQDKEIPLPPSASSSRERVTAEMPPTASGKHESVLAREGGMGTQNCRLVCALHL